MTPAERWASVTARKQAIVLAADVESLDAVRHLAALAAEVAPAVAALKIGALLAMRYGLIATVRSVADVSDIPIIYDHQKAATDIPPMGRPFARACREAGVHAVIFFPLAGPRTLEGFVEGAREEGLVPIVGLAMSHPAYLNREGGYITDTAPAAICEAAIAQGIRDFVLPGTKLDITRSFAQGQLAGMEARLFMPGVGSQGGTIRDAVAAAEPHAAFPIVGSAIYAAADQRAALKSFVGQVMS